MLQPTKLAFVRGRVPRSAGSIFLALVSVSTQMIALAAVTGAMSTASINQPSAAAMAGSLVKGIACRAAGAACDSADPVLAGDKLTEKIMVPKGSSQCPNSGAGAACSRIVAAAQPGTAAVPSGLSACPTDGAKPDMGAPGACSDKMVAPIAGLAGGAPVRLVPDSPTVTLTADHGILAAGSTVVLEAQSSVSVSGTPWAIEIFDTTSHVLAGSCSESSACSIAYTGKTGDRAFVAYVMNPTTQMPAGNAVATSNRVDTRWLGVSLSVGDPSIVAPGKPITFAASASEDVGKIGYRIELRDASSGDRVTFCSQGTTCSTSLVEPAAGTRSVVAQLVPQSPATHATSLSLNPTSGTVSGTWLGIELNSSSTAGLSGGTVSLNATANADLSHTPWSIYIQNESGQVIGKPCNAGSCSATITVGANDKSRYRAVIARSAPDSAASHLDLQASSPLVRPTRLLWGVDSCKSYTDDPSGNSGLLAQVTSMLGTPGFWGRYLPPTGNCPGLSSTEISAAHARHMGILPIYNDYDCSAVSTNPTGSAFGLAAVHWAWNDVIPQGTGIAIDIEPPGDACPGAANVDKGFIEGWYDQLKAAGFVPAYYGNTSAGSEFANAWCAAVAERPDIADNSFVWSFEPSLIIGHGAGSAPGWMPNNPGCAGHYVVWQYSLSSGSAPDVDVDEATSEFPFWWP